MPPMLEPRIDPRGVVAIDDKFYIIDGLDHDQEPADGRRPWEQERALEPRAEKFDPTQQTWQALSHRPGPKPVDFVAVTALHHCLY